MDEDDKIEEEEAERDAIVESATKSFNKVEQILEEQLKDCEYPQEVLSGALHAVFHCAISEAPNKFLGVQMIVSCLDEVMFHESAMDRQEELRRRRLKTVDDDEIMH
jgi:hypothetical protein